MERLRQQSTIFVPLFRWHNGRLTVRATYSQRFRWRYLMTVTQHIYRRSRGGVGNKSLFFFFFFFQKVASDPTEYREDHFKLYPQVISLVSSNKKKLLLESNSKGTIFSYRLGRMGGGRGGGGVFEITWFS